MFAKQIPFLQKYFKLILFDAEGHGKSTKNPDELKEGLLEKTILDLERLLEILKIKNGFGIIGHSLFGASVGIKFAEKNSEKVKFLILLNPGYLILDSTIKNVFWNLLPQFTRMQFNEIALHSLDALLNKTIPFIRGAIIDKDSDQVTEEELRDVDFKIQKKIDSMIDNPLQPTSISCPTLLIGAELDNFAPVFMVKYLHRFMSRSELEIIPMAGHFGLEQRYSEYNKKIYQFLQQNDLIEEDEEETDE